MNVDFLKKEGVTHIVNTAKGLETQFGPRYTVSSCPHTLNMHLAKQVNSVVVKFNMHRCFNSVFLNT